VAVQSSVRTGWWRQLTAPKCELILPALKGWIFHLNIAYHVKCKTIPVQALKCPEGSRSLRLTDFETIGTWKWLVFQRYPPVAFTPKEIFLVFISVRGWFDFRAILRPEVLGLWKIHMKLSRIQTASLRHAAHYVKHMRQSVQPSLIEYETGSGSVMCKEN